MVKVNVATLKAELSHYLDLVVSGEQILVTSHGKEIAKMSPTQVVNTTPIDWKDFTKNNKLIKPKNKGTGAASLISQIRDDG